MLVARRLIKQLDTLVAEHADEKLSASWFKPPPPENCLRRRFRFVAGMLRMPSPAQEEGPSCREADNQTDRLPDAPADGISYIDHCGTLESYSTQFGANGFEKAACHGRGDLYFGRFIYIAARRACESTPCFEILRENQGFAPRGAVGRQPKTAIYAHSAPMRSLC